MSYGGRFLDPNADRCLRQAKVYLWHAWTCVKSAARWQFTKPKTRRSAREVVK